MSVGYSSENTILLIKVRLQRWIGKLCEVILRSLIQSYSLDTGCIGLAQ